MGTDYRLFTDSAFLDLDTLGQDLFNAAAAHGFVVTQDLLTQDHYVYAGPDPLRFDRTKHPWRGVWIFLREYGEATIVSEHEEAFDESRPLHFSLLIKKGNWKLMGYGPVHP